MPSYRYEHIHLMSPDALKSAEFYEKMFGAIREEVRELPDGGLIVFLSMNGSNIVINQIAEYDKKTVNSLDHFGFTTDNIEASVAELKKSGVKFKEDIFELPPEGKQPRRKIAFFWGPDKVLIELRQLMDS